MGRFGSNDFNELRRDCKRFRRACAARERRLTERTLNETLPNIAQTVLVFRSWTHRNPLRDKALGRIAQLVEQLTLNQRVVGSNPTAPTTASLGKTVAYNGLGGIYLWQGR